MQKVSNSKAKKIFWFLVVATVLFWIPFTRRIVLFVLPLGKGVDDIVFWVLAGAVLILAYLRGQLYIPGFMQSWFYQNKSKKGNSKNETQN